MSLQLYQPTEEQADWGAWLYQELTDRKPGDRVDCASCGQRHERDALIWYQITTKRPEWLMASICDDCAALPPSRIERGIAEYNAPARKATHRPTGTTVYILDPDFARDRRS